MFDNVVRLKNPPISYKMNPNLSSVEFIENFNLTAQEAYEICLQWLLEIKAKIKLQNPSCRIEAVHGTIWAWTGYSPNFKKEKKITITSLEKSQSGVNIHLIANQKKLGKWGLMWVMKKVIESWWNQLFLNLWLLLKNQEKEPLSKEKQILKEEPIPVKKMLSLKDKIRKASLSYTSIHFKKLAKIIQCDDKKLLNTVSDMISSKKIDAIIEFPNIIFKKHSEIDAEQTPILAPKTEMQPMPNKAKITVISSDTEDNLSIMGKSYELTEITQEIEVIKAQISKLDEKLIEGSISEEKHSELIKRLEEKLKFLQKI